MFSIYLSNDGKSPGDISFGGYDLKRFAKTGHVVHWMGLASNTFYWDINSAKVTFNNVKISDTQQTIIFDNGMSLAMAPEKSFIEVMKVISNAGFKCSEGIPIWSCQGTE